ncbi:MAG: pyridoxamine 5-phosphate oxidase [Solirubrobacteraceae bacterium]|nr:pyridoxamine 5-phosphate oxidase [Solirubrobacteraceae bacterium]
MSTSDPLASQRLAAMRRTYQLGGLDEADLEPTWLAQLRRWLDDAAKHGILDPNAMVLATATPDGAPSARTVLLKGLDDGGLVFHTNYASRKGRELEANPRAAVVFPWYDLQRQVLVEGTVARMAEADSSSYWASRPHRSQIGSAASRQSQVIGSRAELEERFAALEREHPGEGPIPRPAHWGGLRLAPDSVEFWQGRLDRLHDRLRFRRSAEGWIVERLEP